MNMEKEKNKGHHDDNHGRGSPGKGYGGQGSFKGPGRGGRGQWRGRRELRFHKIQGQHHFKFNSFPASSWTSAGQQNFKQEELPVNEFKPEEFVELRTNNTEESALAQLKELATELTESNKSTVKNNERACFICCNNYSKESYILGVGPINDSVTVAANHKFMGYTVYFLHNPKANLFLEYLKILIQKTTEYLTAYYTGHGSSVSDKQSDEADGNYEVLIFDDSYIRDDKLAEVVRVNVNGKTKIILLNDCCHSGTIYDIPTDMTEAAKFPANIICLSAADDDETAKQGKQGSNDQGFFTFFAFQEIRRNRAITPEEIKNRVSSLLVNYHQCVVVTTTREELIKQPLFPQA